MHREANILQQRVKVLAVAGWREDAIKRVGRKQHEGQKADTDPCLHRQRSRLQCLRNIGSKQSNSSPENRQNECPEQKRAFMAAPCARHLIQHRFE